MATSVRKRIGTNLTEGSIMKGLIIFAIPIILTNIIQQLYSLVDLVVIGQFVGNIGTVGVNTGGEMADMVAPIAMGFSTAGQIYIAQLFGAKQEDKIKKTVGTLLTFMMGMSLILAVVMVCFSQTILGLLNCPQEALGQAMSYMIITAVGYPFIFGYNAVVGILRGMGESKRPLYFILVAAVVNIVLDIILVAVFKMEAAGTAIATVASQIGSFAASYYYMWKRRDQFDFEFKLKYLKIDGHILWILVKLGIPQVVRSMFVRVGMLWTNANINAYGLIVSTTNSVGNKLQKFLEVFISGIDTASASMIGQNLGARQYDRAKHTTLCTVAAALLCACVSTAICLLFPKPVFSIFTNDQQVIDLGVIFLRIFCIHFFASAINGSFQAVVTGSGFVELGFILGLFDGLICKIGFSILFTRVFGMGYEGIWFGIAFSRFIPGMICIAYFVSGKWKTRKLLTD